MDYGLLWIAAMVTSLLFTALAVAVFSWVGKTLWRHLGVFLVIGVMTFVFGIACLFSAFIYFGNFIPHWLFPYTASFCIIYIVAAAVIWCRGLSAKSGTSPARDWKKTTLAFAAFLGIFITLTSYFLIDLNRKIEFSSVNAEIKTKLQTIWPLKPPSHLNSFPLYDRVSNALNDKERGRILDYIKPDQQVLTPEMEELIGRNQTMTDTIHRAAKILFHFSGSPCETSIIWLFEFPQFPSYRHLAGLLVLKARAEVLSGKPAGALRELNLLKSMVKHLQSSPDMLSWMYSRSVTKQEFDCLEFLLARTASVNGLFPLPVRNTPSILLSCNGSIINESAIELQLPFLMMQGSVVIEKFIQDYSEMFHSIGRAPPMGLSYILHPLPRSIWRVFIGQSYLDNVRDSWSTIKKIGEKSYRHWEDFRSLKAGLQEKRDSLLMDILFTSTGDDSFFLSFINFIDITVVAIDAYQRLMELAIASAAYREAKGSYPTTVEELLPTFLGKVTIDPYDGKPLKIKPVDGGLDLHSIGPGGKEGAIHFYLGMEAYQKYRIEPAKLKRMQEAEKKEEWGKKRIRKPGRKIMKKKK